MLDIHTHDGVVEIRMARPPANALDRPLIEALADAVESPPRPARALVLTGQPGMFSAGLDVPAMLDLDREQVYAVWAAFFRLSRLLAGSPVPVIAAVSGHAPAGGAVLALHCDLRIGVEGNFRIGLNEVQVGLPVPRGILAALEHAVGPRLALRLAMGGELLPMTEALKVGLIDELVAPKDLLATALARAQALLALPPQAMNVTRLNAKAALLDAVGRGDDAADATAWWFSAETQAGMRALAARLRSR